MNKVKIAVLAAVAALSASQASADAVFGTSQKPNIAVENTIKPYMVIGNYLEDRQRVFMFFSFNCPYCMLNIVQN